ncbi:MAG: hypothetical protein KGS72_15870 [Cyanobacteria bacterium REEB67]|nr:hypothetical protein [Cyanobacteria bacterium REEB67]
MHNHRPAQSTAKIPLQFSAQELAHHLAAARYTRRQRLMSGSLGVLMAAPLAGILTQTSAQASTSTPSTFATTATSAQHSLLPSAIHHALSGVDSVMLTNSNHSSAASLTANTSHTGWQATSVVNTLHGLSNLAPNVHDVSLRSSATNFTLASLFSPSSLAGFTSLTLDIGGKSETFRLDSKLTGAELVAAEQVLSGSKQSLVINASGVATGGSFDLNSSTLSALDNAVGGSLGSLAISHGVQAIDSLASLQLAGSLVNYGSILLGADSSAKGQTLDTISALNIYNASGGSISSATQASGLTPTSIALAASNLFYNSGTITSSGTLNISAPMIYNLTSPSSSAQALLSAAQNVNLNGADINNSGVISALTGSINIVNSTAEQSLNLNNTGGAIQALKGDINIESSGDSSSNINVNGGNFLSQQLNLNAGCGAVDVNVGNVNGVVNTTAGSAHIAAATENLQLGVNNVSGDPIFINSAGDVTIDKTFVATPGQDLAVVASRNIIGNGGTLDTSSTTGNGGAITLVAGANFTSPSSSEAILTDSTARSTKGSATGGYIDLSGITLGTTKTNTPVVAVNSSSTNGTAGAVTMVAYTGSQANSGSIVATETATQTGGATSIDAFGIKGNGAVTLIGAGAQITAQNINGGTTTISGGIPTITGGTSNPSNIDILNGTIQAGSGSFSTSSATNTTINVTNINSNGAAVALNTGGKIATSSILTNGAPVSLTFGVTSGTATAPITADTNALTVNSPKAGASITLQDTASTGTAVTLNTSTLSTSGALNLTANESISLGGAVTAGTVNLTTANLKAGNAGDISGIGLITAATSNLKTAGAGNISVNTAVNTLAVNAGGAATIEEGATSSKALLLNASSVGSGQNLIVDSAQQVTVNGALTATNGSVRITDNGTATTSNPIGINVGAAINVGSGVIILTTTSGSIVESKGAVLTAPGVFLFPGGVAGTAAAPIVTKAGLLTVDGSSTDSLYFKDIGTTTFAVSGVSAPGTQNISISSAAANLGVENLSYSDVTITGTNSAGVTRLSAGGGTIGDGTGAVVLNSMGSITYSGTFTVAGTSVAMTSTKGSIGVSGTPIIVSAPILTANATTGSVFVSDSAITTLNAGTAKVEYNVSAYALTVGGAISAPTINLAGTGGTSADLVINANIGTASTLVTNLSAVGNMFQTNIASAVAGKAITLTTTGNGALIGFGPGTQSVVTKATTTLGIDAAANSVSYVTQNGSILFSGTGGSGANLNLALGTSGGKLTTGLVNYDTLSLTAPSSFTLLSTASITSNNLTITSPTITFTAGGIFDIATAGSATFASTGALAILGPSSVFTSMPTTLTFTAPTSITLGVATTGLNNPFPNIGASTLENLTINTNGLFKGAYTSFVMNPAFANDSVSITASNIINTSAAVGTPFVIAANGTSTGSASLTLTGAQAVVLGTTAVTPKTQVEYTIEADGAGNNSVSVAAGGNLTLKDQAGIVVGGTNNAIALSSNHFLSVPFDIFNSGVYNNVSLGAGAGRTFVIGANSTQLANGIIGTITAPIITVSDPTSITVNNGFNITGGQLSFQTGNLINNAVITGTPGGGIAQPSLSIGNAVGNVTTSTSNSAAPGTYVGFTSLRLQSNIGSVNTTNLLPLLNSGTLDNITISAATTLTLPTTLYNLAVNSGGTIYVNAGTVSYAPSSLNPQSYLSLTAPGGNVSLTLGSALTLGQVRGQYDIEVGSTGSYTAGSLATLTVNEVLTTANGQLNGKSIVINDNVIASSALTVQSAGAITESVNSLLSGGSLTIGNGSTVLPTAALNISSGNVSVLYGALNLANAFIGNTTLSQTFTPTGIKALTFTNSQANELTVNSIFTTGGSITIVNNKGELSVSAGSTLQTTNGSITLQNNDLTSGIDIGKNVTLYGSSIIGGLGQVNIVMGKVPTTGLLAGPQPSPSDPVATSSGNGKIYYTTTANPHSTITANGLNTLNAKGRNIVFNGAGNSSAIVLEGGDSITADPPVVSGPAVAIAATASAGASALLTAGLNTPAMTASASASNTVSSTTVNSPSITAGSIGDTVATVNSSLNTSNLAATVGLNNAENLAGGNYFDNGNGLAKVSQLTGFNQSSGILKLSGGIETGSRSHGDTARAGTIEVKHLGRGATLYAPSADTRVETGLGTVDIAAHSVVMVLAFDGGAAVYNLHDTRRNAVVMDCGGHRVAVAPGSNVVMTNRNVHYFEEVNPAQQVGYRRMVGKDLKDGMKCFQSEFNILSMLQSLEPLKNMVRSEDSENRKLASAMLKTAAILMQIGGGDRYEYMTAAPVTALNSQNAGR